MKVYESLDGIPESAFGAGTALAIGKFDGMHLGHQALIEGVVRTAQEQKLHSAVLTFMENPLSLLDPKTRLEPLMSPAQKLEAIAATGAESCVILPFDEGLASMSAETFIERVLIGTLRMKHLCVGMDFHFGHGGIGDDAMLIRAGERLGFTVDVIPLVGDPELGRISSSRVREVILQGDVASAARMLGHPIAVRGEVVHGDARGRELGFPTANLGEHAPSGDLEGIRPADGVYAGWALVDGVRYAAAISVGVNLTFETTGVPRIEAFILDYSGDLYGTRIEVQFVERIRGMVGFNGVEALIERIHDDVRQTRVLLTGR